MSEDLVDIPVLTSQCGAMQNASEHYPGYVLSTILRHDAKTTSYKMALLRAIADVALSFPDLGSSDAAVAVPLTALAEFWIAYYWPFADAEEPIWQGARSQRGSSMASDMAFRPPLTRLRCLWEQTIGVRSLPSDGYLVTNELRIPRKRKGYPQALVSAFDAALAATAKAVQMPIRYAGSGSQEWGVFPRPTRLSASTGPVRPIPGTVPTDLCLVVPPRLWTDFQQLSLWIEALCIHQWCLFTEVVDQTGGRRVTRGDVYELLTDRPNNRRPLTWERNEIDIMLMEGVTFRCPWTKRHLERPGLYDLDHIIPVSVYPMNEMWNLVPSDEHYNQRVKRDRLPSKARLLAAIPVLADTYSTYAGSASLGLALREDSARRFASLTGVTDGLPLALAKATTGFAESVALARNLARF